METIVGLFENERNADQAISWLQQAGFNSEQFGVVAPNRVIEKVDNKETLEQGTIQAEDKLGASGGAAVGGLTGLLAGLTALAIPGVGPTVLAGALMVGAATGFGTATGGLLGWLTSMGISEQDAEFYREGVTRGHILVVVQAEDDRLPFVREVMTETGAIDMKTQQEVWQAE